VNSVDSIAADSGSFRDRDGRIYRLGDRIIRGISSSALQDFEKLQTRKFYKRFLDNGQIVASELLDTDQVPLPDADRQLWSGFIEHERIPVISYPYEWTFGMLRDAAVLQLDLTEAAIL